MISISTQYYFLLFEIMYCSKDNIYCGISTYHNQQRFRIRSLLKERNVQFVLYNFPRKSLKYLAVTFWKIQFWLIKTYYYYFRLCQYCLYVPLLLRKRKWQKEVWENVVLTLVVYPMVSQWYRINLKEMKPFWGNTEKCENKNCHFLFQLIIFGSSNGCSSESKNI